MTWQTPNERPPLFLQLTSFLTLNDMTDNTEWHDRQTPHERPPLFLQFTTFVTLNDLTDKLLMKDHPFFNAFFFLRRGLGITLSINLHVNEPLTKNHPSLHVHEWKLWTIIHFLPPLLHAPDQNVVSHEMQAYAIGKTLAALYDTLICILYDL